MDTYREIILAIATALQTVAEKLDSAQAAALPSVSASDNGKIMLVSGGAWAKGAAPTELPAVTASDNGKILKVVEGVWAAASAE